MSPAAGGNFPAQATAYNGPYAPTKPLCAEPTGTTVSCQREAVSISAGGRSLSPGGRSGWDPGAPSLQSSPRLGPALAAATYCAAGLNGAPKPMRVHFGGACPGSLPPPVIAHPRGVPAVGDARREGGISGVKCGSHTVDKVVRVPCAQTGRFRRRERVGQMSQLVDPIEVRVSSKCKTAVGTQTTHDMKSTGRTGQKRPRS